MTANFHPPKTSDATEDEIDLLALFFSIYEQWVFVAIITGAFLLGGLVYAFLATPIYKANAVIQVEQKSSGIPGLSEVSELFGEESSAITEIELIRSRKVIGVAVEKERLDTILEPNYFPVIGKALAKRGMPITMGHGASGKELLEVTTFTVPESQFGEEHTIEAGANGSFRLLSAEGDTILTGVQGELAQKAGYAIFVQQLESEPKVEFTITKSRFLNSILHYQQALSVSEKGKDSGIIVLSLEHESPQRAEDILNRISDAYIRQNVERHSAEAAQSLDFLHGQLPDVRKNLEGAEEKFNQFQVEAGSVDISVETEALLSQVVAIESDIAQLRLQRAELDRKYTKDHPTYVAWQEQLTELIQRKTDLDDKVKSLPFTQQELLGLRRDLEVSTVIYTQMLNNIQELDIARAGAVGNVRLIDEAATNVEEPVKPNRKIIVALSFILGLFLAIAMVLVRRALHNGIETPEEIEALGLPVYATVPLSEAQVRLDRSNEEMGKKDKILGQLSAKILAEHDPTDVSIEALRSLRTSLHFAMLETKSNAIMISGASPGIGKSFVSANLAAVIANSGKQVLLIDADMRRGPLHSMLRIDNSMGLSEVLSKQAPLSGAIRRTEISTLYLMPRGSAPPNPSELLMSEFFTECMDRVKQKFDFVIIDTPPILAVTDANIIGQHCGVTFLVVRHGKNTVKEIEVSYKRFMQSNVPVKGAILNAVEKKTAGYGYGYNSYNYAYDYKPKE